MSDTVPRKIKEALEDAKAATDRREAAREEHEERLTREQAAERLADIAFALTVGPTLEVTNRWC